MNRVLFSMPPSLILLFCVCGVCLSVNMGKFINLQLKPRAIPFVLRSPPPFPTPFLWFSIPLSFMGVSNAIVRTLVHGH